MACPLLPNGGWELQSGGSLFLLFLSHNLRSGPSPPVPSPLCAQTPGLPSSLPGSPGSWLAGQGQTQGGVLWRARVARLGAQAELWAGSQPQASPPALSFTWLLGKACAKPTITSSHRAIGPLANGLLGFLRAVGEDRGGSLHFSFRVAGCRDVKGICREAADRFLFSLQMLSWPLTRSIAEWSPSPRADGALESVPLNLPGSHSLLLFVA